MNGVVDEEIINNLSKGASIHQHYNVESPIK
jgi:hypothetical protein